MFGSGETVFGSGETEVRGMWVLSPGETPKCAESGCFPRARLDERGSVVIIGLLLCMTGLRANSQEVLSRGSGSLINHIQTSVVLCSIIDPKLQVRYIYT